MVLTIVVNVTRGFLVYQKLRTGIRTISGDCSEIDRGVGGEICLRCRRYCECDTLSSSNLVGASGKRARSSNRAVGV